MYLVLLRLFFIHGCLRCFSGGSLLTESLEGSLFLLLGQGLDFLGGFGKVGMFTKIPCISKLPRHVCLWDHPYVLPAWNSTCAMLLNFFPHSLHFMDRATSPSLRGAGSMVASVSSSSAAGAGFDEAWICSMVLSWLSSSHCRAPCTVDD